jgi:hypothetical protein
MSRQELEASYVELMQQHYRLLTPRARLISDVQSHAYRHRCFHQRAAADVRADVHGCLQAGPRRRSFGCWKPERQGDGQLALIVGEPRLGKSHLIEEFIPDYVIAGPGGRPRGA